MLAKFLTKIHEECMHSSADKFLIAPLKSRPPQDDQHVIYLDIKPNSMFSTNSSPSSSSKPVSSSSQPASSTLGNPKPKERLMDSGASDFATGDLEIMFDVTACYREFNTSNGKAVSTLVGSAYITFECGTKETLEEVYYLPGCKASLLSEDKLTRERPDPAQEFGTTR